MTNHIRPCSDADLPVVLTIINDAAEAYRGVIPPDRWHEPYLSEGDLREETASGATRPTAGCQA